MNPADRINRLEAQIAAARRQLIGFLSMAANPTAGPAIRLAQVTTVVDNSPAITPDDAQPLASVYGIKFVDGTFDDSITTLQNPTLAVRATTEYAAAAIGEIAFGVGDLLIVARSNGGWWIVRGASGLVRATANTTAFGYDGAVDFVLDGRDAADVTTALVRNGVVIQGHTYFLQRLYSGGAFYECINPSKMFVGKTTASTPQGQFGGVELYKSNAGTGANGYVASGATNNCYNRVHGTVASGQWVECHEIDQDDAADPKTTWEMQRPDGTAGNAPVTATADGHYLAGETTSFEAAAYAPTLTEGLVLSGRDYRLIWVDDTHYEVANPQLRARGVTDAAIAQNATGTVSVHYRSGSTAYTDTTKNVTALNDLDADIASGAVVELVYEPYGATPGWRIVQTDFTCP